MDVTIGCRCHLSLGVRRFHENKCGFLICIRFNDVFAGHTFGVTIGYYTVFSLPMPHYPAPSAYFIPLLVRMALAWL